MLFAVALVLAQALAIQANVFHSHPHAPATDVAALCAGKPTEQLDRLSQLKEIEASPLLNPKCTRVTILAIRELVQLVESTKDDLCSVESIDKMRAFYHKYLDSSAGSEQTEKLPKSLRRFSLAYGLQMSNLCKKNMVRVLTEDGAKLLTPEDFAQVEELVGGDDSPVASMLGDLVGPDEIFLPGDLAPLVNGQHDKLFLQTATGSFIENLKAVCQHRFKPIYGPLMLPLVQLANMGFNYKDKPLKCDLKCPAAIREVGKWSKIVFLCESISNINIVETPADRELGEGSETKLVRIVTPEEAEAIQGHPVASGEEQRPLETAVYQPAELVSVGPDVVYDLSDKRLHKAIKAFKTSRSEEENVKKRLLNKGKQMIKKELKAGHVGFIFSSAYKGAMQKTKGGSPGTELVRVLNDAVENDGNHLDGPVSGDDESGTTTAFKVAFILGAMCLFVGLIIVLG